MIRASMLRAGAAALAALTVSACISVLPESEPRRIYRLEPPAAGAQAAPVESAPVIVVERPLAPRGLASDRIALSMADGRISYIDGASWISPAPDMVHDLVLEVFRAEAPGLAAVRAPDGVQDDWRLRTELTRFEAVYDRGEGAAPLVEVTLRARLVDSDDRRLAGARAFSASARAADNRQSAIVDAFGEAARSAAGALTAWSGARIDADAD